MRELKGNRDKDNSYAYREGGLKHIRRIKNRETMTWLNLRHTAFVLMIEDNPDLRETSELIDFAKNGFTSLDQFQKNYLDKMDIQRRASESRKKVKVGKCDLIKRVEIH